MKTRKLALGSRNLVGARVTEARLAQGMKQNELLARLQTVGVDLSTPALSLLEGQKRPVGLQYFDQCAYHTGGGIEFASQLTFLLGKFR